MAERTQRPQLQPGEQAPPETVENQAMVPTADLNAEPNEAELKAAASDADEEFDLDALDDQVSATDPITRYLREIGRTALLTAAEEVELAQTIERGKEARSQL